MQVGPLRPRGVSFDDGASLDHAHDLAGRHCNAQQVTLDEITPLFERQLDAKR